MTDMPENLKKKRDELADKYLDSGNKVYGTHFSEGITKGFNAAYELMQEEIKDEINKLKKDLQDEKQK